MGNTDLFSWIGWPRSASIVADASALLQDLRHSARGSPGILGELARLGIVSVPPSVIRETEEHLLRMATSPASESDLHRLWDEYKQSLHVVEINPDEATGSSVEALRARDPRDVPLVAVAQTFHGRAVIATVDRDLISLGLASDDWLGVARSVKQIASVDSLEMTSFVVSRALLLGFAGLLRAARSGAIQARLILSGLAAVLAWATAKPDRRRRCADQAARILRAYGDLVLTRDDHARKIGILSSALGTEP